MIVKDLFTKRYNEEPLLVRSPGRINLIGEHTDYNEGFVLPAAIDKYVNVACSKRNDDLVSMYAVQYGEQKEVRLPDIKPVPDSWTNYVLGVVDQLIKREYKIGGFNMIIDGHVPTGAGLSSSAAIECAVCFALKELFNIELTLWDVALISQKAEHTFPGVQCGIMDQFASVFGKKDMALRLDCRSLEFDEVPLSLMDYRIVLMNTNVKHSLAATAYNKRREECAEGVALVQKHIYEVSSLRDVTIDMLEKYVKDPVILQRCRYVVEENERVNKAVKELRKGNIAGLGEQMYRSHTGLSKEYEVSCKELDYLVAAVKDNPLVAGARMMGGGFGGCTINIVREEAIDELVQYLSENYEKDMGKPLTAYVAVTCHGTELINENSIA